MFRYDAGALEANQSRHWAERPSITFAWGMGFAMPVFVSHSFENKPEFDNIADSLSQAGVQYWNPAEIKAVSSLREQLRLAVEHCAICIFIATHRSLSSSWCGAELGAFSGARKPVIVYLASSSLTC